MTREDRIPTVEAPTQGLASRICRELEANRGILRNVLPTLGARVSVIACGLASSIIMAKVLGPAGRGEYFYIVTLAQLATQIGNLGLASSNTFVAARDRTAVAQLAANSFWIALTLGATATVSLVAFEVLIGRPDRAALAAVLVALVPNMIYGLLASNILVGAGRAGDYNLFTVASAALQLAAIIAVGMTVGTVPAMLWVSAGAGIAGTLMLMWLLRRQGPAAWGFNWSLLQREMGFASRVYLATLVQFAVSRLNVVILDHWRGAGEVGQYSIAVQFFDTLLILPSTTALLLFPELVRAEAESRFGRTLRVALSVGLMMTLAALAFVAITPWLIPFMFGTEFAPAIEVVRWMMPGLVAFSVLNIVSQYLAAERFPLSNLLAWVASLPLLAAIGSIMIPKWGAVGAAAALSATYLLLAGAIVLLAKGQQRASSLAVS